MTEMDFPRSRHVPAFASISPSKDGESYERISDELMKKISAGKDNYVY
jgi:hypothetical protein